MRIGVCVLAGGLLLASLAIAGEEKPVELDKVPANIVEVAKELIPDVELVSANTETEDDGSFVYEIQGKLKDGRKVEFDIDPNGRVEEIEIEFRVEDVPVAVLNAIEKKLPGFKPEFIEASHSRSMQVVGYEFVGTLGENKMDIEVSADGRRIVVADQ